MERWGKRAVLAYNALMAVWVAYGLGVMASSADNYEAFGAGVGIAVIIGLWVAGDIIIGVLWLVLTGRRPTR